jgi:aminomethyltransferase
MMRVRALLSSWPRAAFALCAAWLLAYELRVVLAPGLDAGPLTSRGAHDVLLLLASGLCIAAGLRRHRRERLAWVLIGCGLLAWSLGEVYYTAVLWDAAEIPIPSPADIGYLLLPPLALAGILLLLRARTREVPRTLWVDGLIAALAVASLSAAIVLEPVLENVEGRGLEVATSLAYPIGDLILLGLIVGALAGTGWSMDRTWLLLAVGVSTFWLADSLYLLKTIDGTFVSGGVVDTGWWAGLLLIAAAAWQRPPVRVRRAEGESMRLIAVPLGFGLAGLGLLVYGSIAELNLVAIALAAASLLAVMVRLSLTFRDNVAMLRSSRDEALTDSLTDLGNRRALARDLEDLLPGESGAVDEPLVLALYDLDGFKHYNDTFGHPAGDALLARLGHNLSAAWGPRARLPHGRRRVLRALRAGRRRPVGARRVGRRRPLRERRGLHDRLLLRLDPASRGGRGAGGGPAHRRSAHVRAEERRPHVRGTPEQGRAAARSRRAQPHAGGHLSGVAELAERTARRLGLPTAEVERIRHAAELHDVGKVAIPDDILSKTTPLDAAEWAFIHRHPLIGERIVASAPSLARVATLVRSTHERWDGTGYPDAPRGRRDPARRAHRGRRGRLRRHDLRAPLRRPALAAERVRRAAPLRRHAVRPGGGRDVPRRDRRARAARHGLRRPWSTAAASVRARMAAAGAEALERTPLYDRHVAAGARIVPFAGWEMPVQYEGIRAEHQAVRERAGVFDVSHMGEIETTGPDAEAFLQRILSNDVSKLAENGAQYSVLCRDDGGVLDDLFTYRLGGGFLTVTNASNHVRDLEWFRRHADGFDVTLHDRLHDWAMLAVQGPRAREIVAALAEGELPKRFRTATLTVAGAPGVLVCGTGYTGEDGVELLIAPEHGPAVWDALLAGGATPAGLGARDTLRLEVCFHLYGNDLMEERGPDRGRPRLVLQGGHGFIGADAVRAVREAGPARDARPVRGDGLRHRPAGQSRGGRRGGHLRHHVAEPRRRDRDGLPARRALEPGTEIEIDVRGRTRTAEVATSRSTAPARRPDERGRRQLPRRPEVPRRARLGARRRRRRHPRDHLVRAGPARRGGLLRSAAGRHAHDQGPALRGDRVRQGRLRRRGAAVGRDRRGQRGAGRRPPENVNEDPTVRAGWSRCASRTYPSGRPDGRLHLRGITDLSRYTSATDADRREMLERIGVESIDDLFSAVPEGRAPRPGARPAARRARAGGLRAPARPGLPQRLRRGRAEHPRAGHATTLRARAGPPTRSITRSEFLTP